MLAPLDQATIVRSAISIVPQNPDLFEGTLRENIDPVGEYQDVDIWTALEHVCLRVRCTHLIHTDDVSTVPSEGIC